MQKFGQKTFELKNKKTVSIRQAKISDAEKLLKCIRTYIPQSEFIPKLEQEIGLTIEQEREWINSFLIQDNSLLLVAEHKGEIIGNIDLTGSQRKIMEHTAMVGMGIIREWRNSGLGSLFIQSAIEWARRNPKLELLWLQVYSENEIGVHLYRKMGFIENGSIKNFFKKNDRYFHKLTMTLDVNNPDLP